MFKTQQSLMPYYKTILDFMTWHRICTLYTRNFKKTEIKFDVKIWQKLTQNSFLENGDKYENSYLSILLKTYYQEVDKYAWNLVEDVLRKFYI